MQEIENKFESNSKVNLKIKNEFIQMRDPYSLQNLDTKRTNLDFFLTSQSSDEFRPSNPPTKRIYKTKNQRIPMTSPTRLHLEIQL